MEKYIEYCVNPKKPIRAKEKEKNNYRTAIKPFIRYDKNIKLLRRKTFIK